MRRTFASPLYARDEPPPVVMAEMGHADPGLTLAVYAQAMRLDGQQKAQLKALVEGVDWAKMGQRAAEGDPAESPAAPKSAVLQAKRP